MQDRHDFNGRPIPIYRRSGTSTPPTDSSTAMEVHTRNEPTIEVAAADGHAGQYDADYCHKALLLLPEFDRRAGMLSDREVELLFRDNFMTLYSQSGADESLNYRILPNASLAIDVVMTLCARRAWTVLLLEPCFDNLALFGKERGLEILPLSEEALRKYGADAVDSDGADLVFLVVPNNPTGFTPTLETLQSLAERCARSRTTLAIDASFRAYDNSGADHYGLLREAGCSWVVIEDTGKTLPTRERKASILSCSNDLKRDINEICEIQVLGWSAPILLMLNHLIDEFRSIGLDRALHERVRQARTLVRRAIQGTFVRTAPDAVNSNLPVEWLEILDDRYDDLSLTRHLADHGLGVLPGRHFFFSRLHGDRPVDRFIRFSLLKEEATVERGARLLREALLNIRIGGAS